MSVDTSVSRDTLVDLIREHACSVPRYTSYPSVPYWSVGFGEADYVEALDEAAADPDGPLSVYVHVPFCAKRCYYCGCNAMVTHSESIVDTYLEQIEWEMEGVADRIGHGRPVTQLHWGGGTPNFLDEAQTRRLFEATSRFFTLADDAEVGIEMDPRIADRAQPFYLKDLGFNRISMGVQDFDPRVQAAIGRIQPESETVSLLEDARDAGFESVNFDLVYGLPYQTSDSFRRTLDRVVELAPDRIATFSYAHVPESRKIQRAVDASGLPTAEAKLGLYLDTVEHLRGAGYRWVGLDHFALPHDELSVAAADRRLLRNFMGYTTRAAPDQIAFGASGIGCIAGRFVQNDPGLARYGRALTAGHFPVVRGHRLSDDDRVRGRIIQHLMCNLEIPTHLTREEFGGDVDTLVESDVARLDHHVEVGFLDRGPGGWTVTELGRYFLRNVASSLDPYLRKRTTLPTFSSSI